jgi:hypothetical protein
MRLSARVVVSSLVAVGALVAAWPAFAGKPVAVDRDTTTQKLGYLVTQINLMRDSVPPQYRHQLGQARRKLEELSTAVGVAPPVDAGGNYVVLDRESFIANVRWSMGIVASVRNDPACTQWSDALAPWGEDLVNFVNAVPFGRRRPAYAAPPPAPGYAPPPAAPGVCASAGRARVCAAAARSDGVRQSVRRARAAADGLGRVQPARVDDRERELRLVEAQRLAHRHRELVHLQPGGAAPRTIHVRRQQGEGGRDRGFAHRRQEQRLFALQLVHLLIEQGARPADSRALS